MAKKILKMVAHHPNLNLTGSVVSKQQGNLPIGTFITTTHLRRRSAPMGPNLGFVGPSWRRWPKDGSRETCTADYSSSSEEDPRPHRMAKRRMKGMTALTKLSSPRGRIGSTVPYNEGFAAFATRPSTT